MIPVGARVVIFSVEECVQQRGSTSSQRSTPSLQTAVIREYSNPQMPLKIRYRPSGKNLYLASFCHYTWKIRVLLCVVIACYYSLLQRCKLYSILYSFKFAKNKRNFTDVQNVLLISIFQDLTFTNYLTIYSLIFKESLKQFGLIYCWFQFMDGEIKGE